MASEKKGSGAWGCLAVVCVICLLAVVIVSFSSCYDNTAKRQMKEYRNLPSGANDTSFIIEESRNNGI